MEILKYIGLFIVKSVWLVNYLIETTKIVQAGHSGKKKHFFLNCWDATYLRQHQEPNLVKIPQVKQDQGNIYPAQFPKKHAFIVPRTG